MPFVGTHYRFNTSKPAWLQSAQTKCDATQGCRGISTAGLLVAAVTAQPNATGAIASCAGVYLAPISAAKLQKWGGAVVSADTVKDSEYAAARWQTRHALSKDAFAAYPQHIAGQQEDMAKFLDDAFRAAGGYDSNPEALRLALLPDVYDARDTTLTGGVAVIQPAQDQSICGTCVGFAVMSAASAAIAAVTRSDYTALSVQNFYFGCNPDEPVRTCTSGWTLKEAADFLKSGVPIYKQECNM